MSERRSERQIRTDIEQNAKDALTPNLSDKSYQRNDLCLKVILCELLLDIREHLDSIDCSVVSK